MKVPKTEWWDINGVRYQVVIVDPSQLGGDHGICDTTKGLIQLSSELTPSPRAAIKRHEFGHAAWWESGAGPRIQRELGPNLSNEIEEDVLDRFLPVYHNIRRVR